MTVASKTPEMPQKSKPKKRSFSSFQAQEARLAWMLISPTLLIVFGLVLFPAVFSVWISFHKVGLSNINDVFHAPFIGFENYTRVFSDFAFKYHDYTNMGAAITSIVYSFTATIMAVLLGLIASLLLNQPFRGRGVLRAIFLFSYIAPIVSVAFVWRWMLDPKPSGVINYLLLNLHLIDEPIAYLATRGWALFLVILFDAWRYFPFAMLMILARLQAIDKSLYEAASVDGATTWNKFLYVTAIMVAVKE